MESNELIRSSHNPKALKTMNENNTKLTEKLLLNEIEISNLSYKQLTSLNEFLPLYHSKLLEDNKNDEGKQIEFLSAKIQKELQIQTNTLHQYNESNKLINSQKSSNQNNFNKDTEQIQKEIITQQIQEEKEFEENWRQKHPNDRNPHKNPMYLVSKLNLHEKHQKQIENIKKSRKSPVKAINPKSSQRGKFQPNQQINRSSYSRPFTTQTANRNSNLLIRKSFPSNKQTNQKNPDYSHFFPLYTWIGSKKKNIETTETQNKTKTIIVKTKKTKTHMKPKNTEQSTPQNSLMNILNDTIDSLQKQEERNIKEEKTKEVVIEENHIHHSDEKEKEVDAVASKSPIDNEKVVDLVALKSPDKKEKEANPVALKSTSDNEKAVDQVALKSTNEEEKETDPIVSKSTDEKEKEVDPVVLKSTIDNEIDFDSTSPHIPQLAEISDSEEDQIEHNSQPKYDFDQTFPRLPELAEIDVPDYSDEGNKKEVISSEEASQESEGSDT